MERVAIVKKYPLSIYPLARALQGKLAARLYIQCSI